MEDSREQALIAWCANVLGHDDFRLEVASADASFRRYFRLHLAGGTRIAMDAPPDTCGSQSGFVAIAGMLSGAGVHAPDVLARDIDGGFLLLEDLGRETYLDALDETNADRLMEQALDALVRMQGIEVGDRLPAYDRRLLRAELDLFPEWYVGRHQGIDLTAVQRESLSGIFAQLEDAALAQPAVFVHRDFMPRNLMISDPNPGVIDFQDAVTGPVTYDLLSLLKDAFLSWPEERVDNWMRQYRDRARAAGLPVDGDFDAFRRQLDWMGVQRHLKVIGIFARLCYRDGKTAYMADTPRFFRYLETVIARYRELGPLQRLIDELGSAEAASRPPTGAEGRAS